MPQDQSAAVAAPDAGEEKLQELAGDRMTPAVYWISVFLGGFGILVAINQTFAINPGGFILIDNSYYYLLIAVFLSLSFLIFPAVKRHHSRVPIYDWILFLICLSTALRVMPSRSLLELLLTSLTARTNNLVKSVS